jgi:hypothetical protein
VEGIRLWRDGIWFGAGDVEIDDDGFLAAADDYGFDWFVSSGVEFLMGEIGRDVDEVAGAGFVDEFEVIAPAETGAAADDVDYGFEFAVMVGAGFGVGMDDHRAGPEFLRAYAGVADGFGAGHAGGLRGVGVEVVGADDAQAVEFLVGLFVGGRVDCHRCSVATNFCCHKSVRTYGISPSKLGRSMLRPYNGAVMQCRAAFLGWLENPWSGVARGRWG